VGEAGHEVGGAGATGGDAYAYLAGAARVALGSKTAALLVPRQDRAYFLAELRQGLVNRHAGAARIGENHFHAMIDQALNQDIGPALGHGVRLSHWCSALWEVRRARIERLL